MRLDGISPTMIARALSDEKISPPSIYNGKNIKKTFTTYLWGLSTINQILSNPIYIGDLVQRKYDKVNYKSKKKIKLSEEDWIITQNCVPPIISKDDFKIVQDMKKNNIKRDSKGYNYLLKGLVVCGDCGRAMSVRRRVNKRKTKDDQVEIYYCCSSYIRYRNSVCSLHYFKEQRLNEIVINYLKDIFTKYVNKKDLEAIGNHKESTINEINNLNNEIIKYSKKIESISIALKDIYIDKTNNIISEDEFIEIKSGLEIDKKIYTDKIVELSKFIKDIQKNSDNSLELQKKIKDFLELKNPNKQILMNLIHRIEITKDKQVKIFVNFNLN